MKYTAADGVDYYIEDLPRVDRWRNFSVYCPRCGSGGRFGEVSVLRLQELEAAVTELVERHEHERGLYSVLYLSAPGADFDIDSTPKIMGPGSKARTEGGE